MQETGVQSLGLEDPLEKGMATHSSILAWRIPWTEEPAGYIHGVVRVGHDLATKPPPLELKFRVHNFHSKNWSIAFKSLSLDFPRCKHTWEYLLPRVNLTYPAGTQWAMSSQNMLRPWGGPPPDHPSMTPRFLVSQEHPRGCKQCEEKGWRRSPASYRSSGCVFTH